MLTKHGTCSIKLKKGYYCFSCWAKSEDSRELKIDISLWKNSDIRYLKVFSIGNAWRKISYEFNVIEPGEYQVVVSSNDVKIFAPCLEFGEKPTDIINKIDEQRTCKKFYDRYYKKNKRENYKL